MPYKTYEVSVYDNGDKHWYLNGERHREDGPAIEYAGGDKCWYLNDQLHREDGAAIEYANGDIKYWFLNGKRLTQEQWKAKLNNASCDGYEVIVKGEKYRLVKV